jgi:hypothetical protein
MFNKMYSMYCIISFYKIIFFVREAFNNFKAKDFVTVGKCAFFMVQDECSAGPEGRQSVQPSSEPPERLTYMYRPTKVPGPGCAMHSGQKSPKPLIKAGRCRGAIAHPEMK